MTSSPEGEASPLRPPVAVLLSRFPRVTETFILREVVELERQGQPVVLVPLLRECPPVVHPEARPWMGRALFTPWLSLGIAAANLRLLGRCPGAYLGCVARLVLGMASSPGFLARSLVLFPKAVYLAGRLGEEGVAHVHAHFATHPATVAWVVERLAGIPYSVTVHAHDLFVRRTMLGEKLARARFVRAISRFNREYLAERYPEASARVEVVHVGVSPERYGQRAEAGPGSDTPRGEVRVLTVAALEPYKGIGVLIEAAELVRRRRGDRAPGRSAVTWEVVGEGSLRRRLEAEIARRDLGAAVSLAGALPQDEVARRLARADLFVLPSVVAPDGQMEGIPVALMEALAAGKPVVASRLSGIPELVTDGETGLLVAPGDAEALAEAVARLLREPGLAAQLAESGRRRVEEEFRLETTVAELLALLDRKSAGSALDPELEGPVRELLAAAGLAGRPAGVRRVHDGPDSRVAELLIGAGRSSPPAPGAPRELVAKVHRDRPGQSAPPAERARREHDLLLRLEAAGRGGPYAVPRPLALAEGAAALIMERARGEPLDRLIRELRLRPGRAARTRLTAAFRRAGEWLRWFQGEVGESVRHGDLWPGNVYMGEDRVEAIDLEGSGSGQPGDDAAWFLRHARLYFRLPGLRLRFRALERAFLDGFQRGEP